MAIKSKIDRRDPELDATSRAVGRSTLVAAANKASTGNPGKEAKDKIKARLAKEVK